MVVEEVTLFKKHGYEVVLQFRFMKSVLVSPIQKGKGESLVGVAPFLRHVGRSG